MAKKHYSRADSERYWKSWKPYEGKVTFASGRSNKTLENVVVPIAGLLALYLLLTKPKQQ